ncbi:MAG: hypothetical protein Crog4KO_23140 [Crocinitomicaceae bacterium]
MTAMAHAQISNFDDFFDRTDAFLAEHVSFGRVDYQNINAGELDSLVTFVGTADFESQELDTKKAFLINTYNLLVIKQVTDNYPIKSPMAVDGFFKSNAYQVGGEAMTLNYLENDLMRAKYPDPRYHFVLVCGAIDCPPIDDKAFRPESLEMHLETRTANALNNESFVFEEDGKVYLSQIFEWYSEDFGSSTEEVLNYINGYRTDQFESTKTAFYDYDWTLNEQLNAEDCDGCPAAEAASEDDTEETFDIQTFTAGSLLAKGQMDYTMFNTIYTQTRGVWLGQPFSGSRETFMTSLWQFSIGVDKKKRINLGIDLNLRASARTSDTTASGISAPFAFSNTDSTRVGLTSVGLRAKFAPFKAVKDLSIQTTLYIPTINNPEGSNGQSSLYWADWDRVTMWNQIFWTKTWNKFQLFAEVDALIRFKYRDNQISHIDMPMTAIGSYFPTQKWTVYGIAQHTPRSTFDFEQAQTDWVIPANWTSLGAGVKFQPMSNLTLELLYTNFVRGANTGLGSTFNLGIKYITK